MKREQVLTILLFLIEVEVIFFLTPNSFIRGMSAEGGLFADVLLFKFLISLLLAFVFFVSAGFREELGYDHHWLREHEFIGFLLIQALISLALIVIIALVCLWIRLNMFKFNEGGLIW